MMHIEVEEKKPKPGTMVALSLIGQSLDVFEIRVIGNTGMYWVNDVEVPREVYMDALKTSDLDRWCPGCMGEDDEEHTHPAGEAS